MKNIVYENKILKNILKMQSIVERTNIFKFENHYTLCDIELTYVFNNYLNNDYDFKQIGIDHFIRDNNIRVATQFLLKIRKITEIDINKLVNKYTPGINIDTYIEDICIDNTDWEDMIDLYLELKSISPFIASMVFAKHINIWLRQYTNIKVIAVVPMTHHLNKTNTKDEVYQAIINAFKDFNDFLININNINIESDNVSHKFKGELKHYIMLNNVFTKKSVFKFFNIDEKTLKKIIDNLTKQGCIETFKIGTWIYCQNKLIDNSITKYKQYIKKH